MFKIGEPSAIEAMIAKQFLELLNIQFDYTSSKLAKERYKEICENINLRRQVPEDFAETAEKLWKRLFDQNLTLTDLYHELPRAIKAPEMNIGVRVQVLIDL